MAKGIAISGGGVPIIAPESTQLGSASYTVPANKLAVVSVTQGAAPFTVDNGGGPIPIIPKGVPITVEDLAGVGVGGAHANALITAYTNGTGEALTVSGNVNITAPTGEGFQGGQVYVGSTLIATVPFASGTPLNYAFSGLTLLAGETIRAVSITTWFNPPGGSTTVTSSGTGEAGNASNSSMKVSLGAGITIEGGNYIAEIYSV